MGIIIDVVIILIILLSIFLAYRKGFAKLAINLFTFIIAVVVTFLLYKPVTNFIIENTYLDETIENVIYEQANNIVKEGENQDLANEIINQAKNQILPETAKSISINIITAGVIIILFVITKLLLRLVSVIADLIAKIPIIKEVNKLGGILYGLARGLLIVYIALIVVNIAGQIDRNNVVSQNINNSFIGKMMYENNVLYLMFK